METTQETKATEIITSQPLTPDSPPDENQTELEPQPNDQLPADDTVETDTVNDLRQLIAQAEERGYLRGRNESIARLMERPSASDPSLPDISTAGCPQTLILNNIRPSIWD